jgi:sulfonate transport system ATP-binding protein
MMAEHSVTCTRLVRRYGAREVLSGLDFQIRRGEFVSLLGRSGSGKSTLLRALAGLDDDAGGSGELWATERRSMAFQDARLLPWKSAIGNVVFGCAGPNALEKSRKALAEVGLGGREDAWPFQLSGGEQQRVALARCLVREPELLLADEPFGALDALTRLTMHEQLRALWLRHKPSVLLVTHDVDEALKLSDRVLVLDQGKFVAEVTVEAGYPRDPDDTRLRTKKTELLSSLGVNG